jgi:hypothetical protein
MRHLQTFSNHDTKALSTLKKCQNMIKNILPYRSDSHLLQHLAAMSPRKHDLQDSKQEEVCCHTDPVWSCGKSGKCNVCFGTMAFRIRHILDNINCRVNNVAVDVTYYMYDRRYGSIELS